MTSSRPYDCDKMKFLRRLATAVGILLIAAIVLILLTVPSVNALLRTPLKDKLIEKYVPSEYSVSVGSVHISLWKRFPLARVRLTDIDATLPQDLLGFSLPVESRCIDVSIDLDTLLRSGVISARVDTLRLGASGASVFAQGKIPDARFFPRGLDANADAALNLRKLTPLARRFIQDIDACGKLGIRARYAGESLNVRATSDTASVDLGEEMSVRVSALEIIGWSNFNMVDSLGIPSVTAKLSAGSLKYRGPDSLKVLVRDAENAFSISEVDGRPVMKLNSEIGRAFFGSDYVRAGVKELALSSIISMRDSAFVNAIAVRDSTFAAEAADKDSVRRAALPAFLSDSTFRSSDIDFRLSESIASLIDKWNPEGRIAIASGIVGTGVFPLRNRLEGAYLTFDNDMLTIDTLILRSGSSDLSVSGHVRGIGRVLAHGGVAVSDIEVASDSIDVDEILDAVKAGQANTLLSDYRSTIEDEAVLSSILDSILRAREVEDTSQLSLIVLPANVIVSAGLRVSDVKYGTLDIRDLYSTVNMRERCLRLSGLHAGTSFGSLDVDAYYKTVTRDDISAGLNLMLKDVSAEEVIQLIPSTETLLPMLKSFHGNLNCQVAAASQIDTGMNFILPTASGVFKISGDNLLLDDYGDLKKVTRLLMFKNTDSGAIKDMSVYGTFSNGRLQVFPFVLGIDRYSLALSGWQNLDKDYEYHASVIKSPIPFKFGVKVYNNRKGKLKFRLEKPQYRTTSVPMYNDEVDRLQSNLITSIKNIFSRASGENPGERMRRGVTLMNGHIKSDPTNDAFDKTVIDVEQLETYNVLDFGIEASEEMDALNDEIDEIVKQLL